MPLPVKPCEGRFSEEVLTALGSNRDRAQWANHPCEVCGLAVGAMLEKGKWVPEQHWPTVKYVPRNGTEKKRDNSAGRTAPQEDSVLAESGSR